MATKNFALLVGLLAGVSSLTLGALTAHAEDIPPASVAPAVSEATPPNISSINRNPYKNYVSVSYENDLIGSGTDENYTSGIQFNYFNVDRRPPAIFDTLADSWLGFDIGDATATSYAIGQKIYTPKDISNPNAQPNDRPWAGWLYGSVALSNVSKDHVDSFGLTLGVVGPASLAEGTQKFIHDKITDSPEPMGWDNQLHNEPGLILSWERRWPVILAAEVGGWRLQGEPNVSMALGNVNTFVGFGGTLTFGPNQKELQDTPPRLAPAMSGTGYFDTPVSRDYDWYLFTGINGRAVARDIFLDGNTFRDSESVDKKNFVADANAGVAITYGQTRFSYTLVYRTKEFYGQEDPSIFGSFSVTQRF